MNWSYLKSQTAACIITALSASCALAAGTPRAGSVRWIEKDFDFGLMKELAGPKTGTSRFVNTGKDTLSVFNVRPSCGCTSANFDDGPIAPGDTASISYTYDPHMRPGKFDKSVKVILSDGSRHVIRITGNVLGTPESLATLYPLDAGNSRLSEAVINLGKVTYGRTPVAFFNAYSLSLDSLSPVVSTTEKGLLVTPSHLPAGPGDIITYTVSFDSRKIGRFGPVELPISYCSESGTEVVIPVRAHVSPDVDMLIRSQKGKSPACELRPDPVDLAGAILSDEPVVREITVKNTGSGPLAIYRIYSDSPAVSFGKIPESLKPGKSAKIKLIIDPAALPKGPFRIPVTVISSDPVSPEANLYVAGSTNP